MEGNVRERSICGRRVVGSLKVSSGSMEVKRGLRNSFILPTLMYVSEMWTWNGGQ